MATMPQSIHRSLTSLDELETWLSDAGIREVVTELARLDPQDRVLAFRLLPRERALAVFESLDSTRQQQILEELQDERFRHLVADLDPDDRARLLGEAPATMAKRALEGLSPDERAYTAALLGYPERSAGRVMTPEFVSLRADVTAGEALEEVRQSEAEEETLFVLPVTDGERHLVGSLDLPSLIQAGAEETVDALMTTEVHWVRAEEHQETAARLVADANLAALPVIDSEERLVGMITVDDAVRILKEEETEDRLRAGGAEPLRRPYFDASLVHLAARRATWLLVLVVGATLTVNVLDYFQDTLDQAVTLALFVPLLIGTGGNTGAQATTVVIRAMSTGDVHFSDLHRVVWREARVGVLLGGMLAVIGFPLVSLFFDVDMATVVSITLLAICTWATFAGSMLPMVADRVGIDPAVVSAPFITTLVDATGLIIYFLIARAVLGV